MFEYGSSSWNDSLLASHETQNKKTHNNDNGLKVLSAQKGMEELLNAINFLQNGQGFILKTQTWRADKTGYMFAKACFDAANRGVKIYILKDKKGSTFENGESIRKGFWSGDKDIIGEVKGMMFGWFYQNPEKFIDIELEDKIKVLREKLDSHPNVKIENEIRFDHSKLGLIFDISNRKPIRAIFGGASIGNEWNGIGDEQYIDGVMDVENEDVLNKIVKALSGEDLGWKDGICILTRKNYHQKLREVLDKNNGKITSSVAYIGESSRIGAFENPSGGEILISQKSNANRWRNIHFLYELLRRINNGFPLGFKGCENIGELIRYWKSFFSMNIEEIPDNLQVVFLESMLHMKAVIGEDFAIFGSGNLVEEGYGELGIGLKKGSNSKVNVLIEEIRGMLSGIAETGIQPTSIKVNYLSSNLSAHETIEFSLLRSQIEHMVMEVESLSSRFIYGNNIKEIQFREEELFREKFL